MLGVRKLLAGGKMTLLSPAVPLDVSMHDLQDVRAERTLTTVQSAYRLPDAGNCAFDGALVGRSAVSTGSQFNLEVARVGDRHLNDNVAKVL